MPKDLSGRTVTVVKATVPALEAHGLAITRRMYERMFQNEAIRDLFNQSHHGESGSQPKALAAAIVACARNIDGLAALAPAVERIAQKRVGLNILPEHHPYVAGALLGAIKDVLGDAATEEILTAWGEAYWYLAEVLIAREREIYGSLATASGGWAGWREFRVERKERESDVITSFVLRPADGGPVLRHRPGQYLTLWLDIPGQYQLERNYSISSATDGETNRITVKREPLGVVSGRLHESATPGTALRVAPRAGEFFLGQALARPVVLVGSDVGLTPMMSMLETIAERHPGTAAHYVPGTPDGATHAMGARARELAARSGGAIKVATFYERPRSEDRRGLGYDEEGLITIGWLSRNTPVQEADHFLCGPRPFLRSFVSGLAQTGMASGRTHDEFFGPADELLAA